MNSWQPVGDNIGTETLDAGILRARVCRRPVFAAVEINHGGFRLCDTRPESVYHGKKWCESKIKEIYLGIQYDLEGEQDPDWDSE